MKHTVYGKHPELPLCVSIDGDIRKSEDSNYHRKGYLFTPHETHSGRNGYARISFKHNKIAKQQTVHRLVCETFICYPIPKDLQVDHKDDVKMNNRLENLQLLTPSENTLKSARVGTLNGRATISLGTAQAIWDEGANYWCKYTKGYIRPYAGVIATKYNTTPKIVVKILFRATWGEIERTCIDGR